jgi:hypothetical protein
MTTSEHFWSKLLDDEIARGNVSAEGVFQDYLSVRGANNEIRNDAAEWLFESFVAFSNRLSSDGFQISVERNTDTRFAFHWATLSGSSIIVSNGLRKLSCEVGSIKAPGDGIIKGGGIAIARLSHFGIPEKDQILRLLVGEEKARWVVDGNRPRDFDAYDLVRHFKILLS